MGGKRKVSMRFRGMMTKGHVLYILKWVVSPHGDRHHRGETSRREDTQVNHGA